ncbi:MAG: DNA-protecting protein DprA [Acidobacteria bacterium]|nr:DNA-protecting protein DprA [Acidobacteriota bacterium]
MQAAQMQADEQLNWLALRMVPGLGARTAAKLLERFRSPFGIFRASRSELEAAGASGSLAQTITSGCAFEDAATQWQKMGACGAVAIPLVEPRYPARLREIFDPPIVLFARGRVELLEDLMLAIVGTRRPSPYGIAVTERLAADLGRAGLVIVSGMARGIDTAAHRGALTAGAATVAVLGCGADVVYPTENRKLSEDIIEKGLLISEFPMGAPAYPQNFPIRNRIISGLSAGVMVVEGAQYSGSAITARLALDQGREVFAIPGNITSRTSWGPNLLIKQGAKLVQGLDDVLEELSPEDRRWLAARRQPELFEEAGERTARPGLPEGPAGVVSARILDRLRVDSALHIDQLLLSLEEFSSSEIIAALFELEMSGAIRQLAGKNFVKVWEEPLLTAGRGRT